MIKQHLLFILFILYLLAISDVALSTDTIYIQTTNSNNSNHYDHDSMGMNGPSSDEQPLPNCDWRLSTSKCYASWIHEGILGTSLGCYFSLILAGIILLRRRWKVDWTLSQLDRSYGHARADDGGIRRYCPLFRRLVHYTYCNAQKAPTSHHSRPGSPNNNHDDTVHCNVHGTGRWSRMITSPVDCLLLCWTCYGLLRLIGVTITLLGFISTTEIQEVVFNLSLWPASIGAITFMVGLVGGDPPRRLINCSSNNGQPKYWIHRPPIWCLQFIALFHLIVYPVVTLTCSIYSGIKADLFDFSSSLQWDNISILFWSIQTWPFAIIGAVYMIHCLRVQRRFNSPIYHEAAPSNSNGNGHGHTMTCQPLNNEELLYIRQLNRIYGTVAAVGIAVGLWTLTASLLPVRRIGHTVTSSMLSNIAFNCIAPILAIVIMMTVYNKSRVYKGFYSTNGSYRMLWSSDKRLSPPKMMTEQQHPWSTSNSIYLPKGSLHPTDYLPATSHCSDILESVHSMEMRSPSPMKPPPIAHQRNDRHHHYQQQLYHTNSTATTTDHDYSRTSITSATSYTHYDDQTGKRVFIEGRGPRVSAVGTHNNGFLTVGTYNEEGLVNNASEYMSPRGSFSSGDGRGYIIEMYSVEESAYIEREITDSCDSRV